MKKWLYSFKFILIIILFIGFAAYYYLTKDSKDSKENFQQQSKDGDFHYPHFDISANYYSLTKEEKAQMKAINPDSIILNIGNTLGEGIDINNIPWDSENRSLNPSEILWGAVSREASADIFHKVYVAKQLESLQAAEDNKFYFDSALLHYGTSDPNLGAILGIADFIANFASPLILPMIGQKLGGDLPLFESDVPESPVTKQTNAAKGMDGVMDAATEKREYTKMKAKQHSRISHILSPDKKPDTPETPGKIKEPPVTRLSRLKSQLTKFKASRLLGKLMTLYFDWIELIPPPVGPVLNGIYMIFIMPIVMAIAMPLIAPRKGSNAVVENQIIGVYTTLVAMAVTAGYGMYDPTNIIAQRATMAAALAGALAAYYEQKDAVPAGYKSMMEKMMEATGHGSGDGKCPNNFIPLDRLWNPTTEIFLSFVPIFGDLIDLIYPHMCVRKDFSTPANDRAQNFMENLICVRDPYVLPKYMSQSWISSIFLDWPDYNNKLSTGINVVGGKLRIVPRKDASSEAARGGPYWSWSGYTNYNNIKNNPQNYYNLDIKLDGFKQNNIYQYIGGKSSQGSPDPSLTCKFFYLDFSDPNILVEMAQFYYKNAIRNPQLGDDRTFTIEYIAKINYITASSLFSCDAMCEMVNIKYDARSGRILKQTRTYDSDRRFYFRWRPISDTDSTCKPVSDIWGNSADNSVWKNLDDQYDEAMHKLNDAIHFPNEPGSDSTGLISGELLLTGYELYLEQKERSDLSRDYIISINPSNAALIAAKNTYNLLNTSRIYSIIGVSTQETVTAANTYLASLNNIMSIMYGSINVGNNAVANLINNALIIGTIATRTNQIKSAMEYALTNLDTLRDAAINAETTVNTAITSGDIPTNTVNNYYQSLTTTVTNIRNARLNFVNKIIYYIVDTNRLLEQTNGINTVVGDVISLINDANGLVANAIAANQVVMTTGQLAGVQDTTTLQAAFKTASDNLESALLAVDPFYLDFKISTDTARKNYLDLLGKLYTTNENPNIFFQNDLEFKGPVVRDLQSRMDAVIVARDALWYQHKKDSSTNNDGVNFKYGLDNAFMTSKYYDVTGCTHLDGGALAAITPDVTNLQEDIRFRANFDVLPHLKRCENMNITLDKCIDLSNVEQVIQAFERDKPDIRIKTIHNIQARGNNTCQYIWDEYTITTPTTVRQTTNRILYQQDLSACTFCLPETTGISKVQKIYIDTTDNKVDVYDAEGNKSSSLTDNITTSLTVQAPDDIKHFSLPISDPKNTNATLRFLRANYIQPTLLAGGGQPVHFTPMTGQLLVPRYDPIAYTKLPDLIRPKKPIRILYPNGPESNLGNQTSNYCSNPINMSNFMIDYNNTNVNQEKIVNIQRGFTTGPTTCDYEIDVFIKDPKKPDDNTQSYLTTNISKIISITDDGTTIQVASVTGFTKGMRVNISYSSTPSFTYTQTVSFILKPTTSMTADLIGIAPLTRNMFNPYENALRNAIPSEYKTGSFTIVGFTPEMYKLTTNNSVSSGTLINIVTMTTFNSSTKITTSYVVQFNVRFGSINTDGNTSSTATIISPYGPSSPNTIIDGSPTITAIGTLSSRITSLGTKTVIPPESAPDSEQLYSIYRIITVSETLSSYNAESKTPCLSQSIQGMCLISDLDVSNNKITYNNNMDIQPLDIDFYPYNDRINDDGTHTTSPLINNITITGIIELKNVVTRKTVSYNMTTKEAFINPYTYNTIGTTGGLEIKKNTSTLQGSYSNTGYNFGGPAKSNADNKFGSNTNFYNDNLVTNYTTTMSNLMSTSSSYLKPLVQAIKLSNIVGTPPTDTCASQPLSNVCTNPTYMQRIMDSYNNGNSPIGIYNQERNTMTRIIQSSTASNNECHLIFENKNEFYSDRTYYDLTNSNNYTMTNTLKFMNFPMVIPTGTTTCDFIPREIPLSNVISPSTISIYPAIKASDLTLSYGNNFSPYFTPLRTNICQVGDTDTLFSSLSNDYYTKVNVATNPLRFTSITKIRSKPIGYDKIDYLISQTYNAVTRRYVLRAKFDLAPYPANCVWSYTSNSFKLQIVLPDSMSSTDKATYRSQSFVDIVNTDSVSLGGSDNVSPLFLDPEYS